MSEKQVPLYDKIYLVHVGSGSKNVLVSEGEWRASPRLDPAFLQFFPTDRTLSDENVGTITFDEDMWAAWYINPPEDSGRVPRKMIKGFDNAMSAATLIVKQNPDVFFGCPFCDYRTKTASEYWAHVDDHSLRILHMFSPSRVRTALGEVE